MSDKELEKKYPNLSFQYGSWYSNRKDISKEVGETSLELKIKYSK